MKSGSHAELSGLDTNLLATAIYHAKCFDTVYLLALLEILMLHQSYRCFNIIIIPENQEFFILFVSKLVSHEKFPGCGIVV